MAGSPKKRARKEAIAAAAAQVDAQGGAQVIPEAVNRDDQRTGATRAARTHYAPAFPAGDLPGRRPPPLRNASPGPQVRAMADANEVQQLDELAAVLPSALCVRIERVAPDWCKGWIEDYQLESGGIGELLAYLKAEWGGTTYRLTAISASGSPIYSARQNISAPPKEEGIEKVRPRPQVQAAASAAAPAPAAASANESALIPIMKLMLDQQRDNHTSAYNQLRDHTTAVQRTITDLLKSIADGRERGVDAADPVRQIEQTRKLIDVLTDFRDSMKSAAGAQLGGQGDDDQRTVLQKATEVALMNLISGAMQSKQPFPSGFVPPGVTPPAAAPPPPVTLVIPDARKAG